MQQQALAQVACADACRLELLDTVQHRFYFVQLDIQLRVETGADLFDRVFQITLAVDAVDKGDCDQAVGIGHRCQVQLPQQVALQAFAG
ncbi:hypothetical protein D3C78_915570 [compost metagenome]